ncbi:MAG: hypothetical protein SH819_13500 [Cytophagales bacterium]|nr:hypothetical protein [Cytophagales bacterium]
MKHAATILIKDIQGVQRQEKGKLVMLTPKCVVKIQLRSGEKIGRMVVESFDSEGIVGTVRIRNENHKRVDSTRVVPFADAGRIQVRLPDTGATCGLIAGVVVVGLIFILVEALENIHYGKGFWK